MVMKTESTFKYTSEELNKKIELICDGVPNKSGDPEWPFEPVRGTGKVIWYWGWYWREVDFEVTRLRLCTDYDGLNAGFCEKNKWGYPGYSLDASQSLYLRGLLDKAVDRPIEANLQAVWEFMQETIPLDLLKSIRV